MKNCKLLIFAIVAFVFVSCSKEETKVAPPDPVADYTNSLIVKIAKSGADTTIIKYDVINRITSYINYQSGVNKYEAIYSYQTNVVTEKISQQSYSTNINYYFKPSGQFNQSLGSINIVSSGVYNHNGQFVYDADSMVYQVDEVLTKGATTIVFRDRFWYKDGNIIKKVTYNNNDSTVFTYTYNDKANAFANLERGTYYEGNYGFANKNLLTKIISVGPSGTNTTNITYSYNESDAKVKTRTIADKNGTTTETITYLIF